MGTSSLAVRDINHKYIVVEMISFYFDVTMGSDYVIRTAAEHRLPYHNKYVYDAELRSSLCCLHPATRQVIYKSKAAPF